MNQLSVACLHLLGFGIALGSIFARGRALQKGELNNALEADNWWGVSALILIGSGLFRAFGSLEKGSAYYLGNPFFHLKLGLFALIFALELWPMIRLIQARMRKQNSLPDTLLRRFSIISYGQTGLLLAMLICASAMARGFGV